MPLEHGGTPRAVRLSDGLWTVESLDYLVDLDDETHGPVRNLRGYEADVIDLAHARWACASTITAVDLCAAALQDFFVPGGGRAWSLRDLTQGLSGGNKNRKHLPPPALGWIDQTVTDNRYEVVHRARNPFIHERLPRTVRAGTKSPGAHQHRTAFPVGNGGAPVETRELVVLARALATGRIEAFIDLFKTRAL